MQKTSPIRRYVLLRHRGLDAPAARWSLARIGSAPHAAYAPSAGVKQARHKV